VAEGTGKAGPKTRKSEKFWDRLAKRYARMPVRNQASYEETLALTRTRLSKDDKLLEVGCGTGSTALLLADSVKHFLATDISGNMIAIAADKAKAQQVQNLDFLRATLFDDSLKPGSFDVILAFNLLHLLEDIPAAIGRVEELLKPDGRFISKTPCLAGHSRFLSLLVSVLSKIGIIPQVRFLSIEELESCIRQGNFSILETGNYPASPPSRFIVARRILSGRKDAGLRSGN
jgi:ubiquinone/menaquinone biosynthesis C-methylase UbiE